MCEKMVMKEKEAREEMLGVPIRTEAERAVPVLAKDVDHSCYTIERLRERITDSELDRHHFPTAHEAAAHSHLLERWENVPINNNHTSEKHYFCGRLFENLKQTLE